MPSIPTSKNWEIKNMDTKDTLKENFLKFTKRTFLGFLRVQKKDLEAYFSAESSKEGFTNSQLFFNLFSRGYPLYQDGQFAQMCKDMEKALGKEVYTQLMKNLEALRTKKVKEIIRETDVLTHTSNVPPKEMNGVIQCHSNLNQFGEKRDNFVFATDSQCERDFYALRVNDGKGENINWKKQAINGGERKNVFILGAINQESYTYFLPKEKFTPVVCLDGRFGHEWTATGNVEYSSCKKNEVEDIQKRNTVIVVDSEKFRALKESDPKFRANLDDPERIIQTLENSGVLLESQPQTKKSAHIFSTLSNGKEDGKNDPRDATKTSQTHPEKKTTFPTATVLASKKQRK